MPLFWALGPIDELPPSVEGLKAVIADPEAFIRNAVLRPSEVLDEAEEHLYHQHWRVRDAQLFGKPMPKQLDPGVVDERCGRRELPRTLIIAGVSGSIPN